MTLPALSPDQAEAWDSLSEVLAAAGVDLVAEEIMPAQPGKGRVMAVIFNDAVPEPHDSLLIGLTRAAGLFPLLLAPAELTVRIVDAESFDFALFNEAEECGDAVLTSGAWSEVHPGFAGIPLACDIQVPCFLAFPQTPSPQVSRFVDAMRRVLSEQGE